jgi:hypothetical protein
MAEPKRCEQLDRRGAVVLKPSEATQTHASSIKDANNTENTKTISRKRKRVVVNTTDTEVKQSRDSKFTINKACLMLGVPMARTNAVKGQVLRDNKQVRKLWCNQLSNAMGALCELACPDDNQFLMLNLIEHLQSKHTKKQAQTKVIRENAAIVTMVTNVAVRGGPKARRITRSLIAGSKGVTLASFRQRLLDAGEKEVRNARVKLAKSIRETSRARGRRGSAAAGASEITSPSSNYRPIHARTYSQLRKNAELLLSNRDLLATERQKKPATPNSTAKGATAVGGRCRGKVLPATVSSSTSSSLGTRQTTV